MSGVALVLGILGLLVLVALAIPLVFGLTFLAWAAVRAIVGLVGAVLSTALHGLGFVLGAGARVGVLGAGLAAGGALAMALMQST